MVSTHVTDRPLEEAGRLFTQWLAERKGLPTLVLVSGGSARGILDHVSDATLGAHVTLSVLDERFSADPAVSNFAQLSQTKFYERAQRCGVTCIDTRPQGGESAAALAARFEGELRSWRKAYSDGEVLITQGMGPDGHTAGIIALPTDRGEFHRLFVETERWVVDYVVPEGLNEYRERVTVTVPFLVEEVRRSLMYASGKEKQAVLKRFSEEQLELHTFPAIVLYRMQDVTLVTDVGV